MSDRQVERSCESGGSVCAASTLIERACKQQHAFARSGTAGRSGPRQANDSKAKKIQEHGQASRNGCLKVRRGRDRAHTESAAPGMSALQTPSCVKKVE